MPLVLLSSVHVLVSNESKSERQDPVCDSPRVTQSYRRVSEAHIHIMTSYCHGYTQDTHFGAANLAHFIVLAFLYRSCIQIVVPLTLKCHTVTYKGMTETCYFCISGYTFVFWVSMFCCISWFGSKFSGIQS